MRAIRPADSKSEHVQAFCKTIAVADSPVLVPYEPLLGQPTLECFSIVPEHVVGHGGKQLTGWAIWERPDVFIEAEFHAVWQDDDGLLHDLTPRDFTVEHILFLPDPSREYTGRQVDNIRKALVDDFYVARFLKLFSRRFEILNKGDLANQHGLISLSPSADRELRELEKEMEQLQTRIARRYP